MLPFPLDFMLYGTFSMCLSCSTVRAVWRCLLVCVFLHWISENVLYQFFLMENLNLALNLIQTKKRGPDIVEVTCA